MDGTSLMMMAFVWGSLLVFFLVPFEGKRRTYSDVKESFVTCLKQSFVEITFHKKALLAFFFDSDYRLCYFVVTKPRSVVQ